MRIHPGGFTLVEAIVGGVIFTIAVTGVFASLAYIKQPVVVSDSRLVGANCGDQFLESLRAKVDARDWGAVGTLLELGAHTINGASTPAIGTFSQCSTATSIDYVVTAEASGARKVVVTVTW